MLKKETEYHDEQVMLHRMMRPRQLCLLGTHGAVRLGVSPTTSWLLYETSK